MVKLSRQSFKHHQYEDRSRTIKQLKEVAKLNQIHFNTTQQQLETINAQLIENKLSLRGVRYWERLKRSLYGLTIDWIKYKNNNRLSEYYR